MKRRKKTLPVGALTLRQRRIQRAMRKHPADYSAGLIPQRAVMDALGLDYYGELIDRLVEAGLPMSIVPQAQLQQVRDIVQVFRATGLLDEHAHQPPLL